MPEKKESIKSIVLLSGPVGSGKSTVARQFIEISKEPLVYIEGDKFWFFIVKGFEQRSRIKNFRTIMTAMTAAAVPYATAGYEVLVDFSIPPWFLDTLKKVAKVRDVPLDFVVLRPSLEVCARRAAARAEGFIPDYEPYKELYSDFDGFEKYTIQNDQSDPLAVALEIRKGLQQEIFRVT